MNGLETQSLGRDGKDEGAHGFGFGLLELHGK